MKFGHALAIGTLALALAACGGDGGKDRTAGTDDPVVTDPGLGLTTDYRIEAVLTSPAVDPGYLYQDPLNFQILDNVTFQLVSYSGSGTSVVRTIAPTAASLGGNGGVTFTTNDTLGATGGLSAQDGTFNISRRDSGTQRYVVTASFNGAQYSAFYRINPRLNQARVHGLVGIPTGATRSIVNSLGETVESPIYQGVYNSEIVFYEQRDPLADADSSPQYAAQRVRTGPDGSFRASVPVPPTSTGDNPIVRALVLPPDAYDPIFTFAGTITQSFTTPAQSDLLSLPTLNVDTPNGGGDFYLIPTADISRLSDGTFYLNNADNLATDTDRLFILAQGSTSAARAKKAAARK